MKQPERDVPKSPVGETPQHFLKVAPGLWLGDDKQRSVGGRDDKFLQKRDGPSGEWMFYVHSAEQFSIGQGMALDDPVAEGKDDRIRQHQRRAGELAMLKRHLPANFACASDCN